MKRLALLCPLALLACEAPFSFPAPVATIAVSPTAADLYEGDSLQLTATLRDSAGQALTDRTVFWSSSDPGRVNVSAAGLVVGLGASTATITAAAEGVRGAAAIRVVAQVVGVTIDQVSLTMVPGGALQLSATPRDRSGNSLGGRAIAWASGDTAVLRISPTGLVDALSPGADTVTATVEGVSAQISVRVERVAFSAVSASEFRHTCGRTTNGRFVCWGENGLGQLGLTAAWSASPVAASSAPNVAEVTSGGTFTCSRAAAGHVYCWGSGFRGRLGTGSVASTPHPGLVPLEASLTTLSSGWNHTCGVGADDRGYCWGEHPQVGNYPSPFASTPVEVLGSLAYRAIAAGDGFTCGLTTDSLAYCWGLNFSGRLGVESLSTTVEPVAVIGGLRFTAIGAGGLHACGLRATGDAWCWGDNGSGQLGAGNGAPTASATPWPVTGGFAFSTIATGSHTTCALTPAGAAYCWGENDAGQLGAASTESCTGTPCSRVPLPVFGALQFVQLSVGDHHSCGLTVSGVVYCWGKNDRGQLGDGTFTDRPVPTRVVGQQ